MKKKEKEKIKILYKTLHRIQLYNWLYWVKKRDLKIMSVINND